jgi:hypothetical protein
MVLGSSAFPVLSNKEKVARVGLFRQRTPTECVRDDFWGEISSNAHLHWFGARSTQLLSTKGADDPNFRVNSSENGFTTAFGESNLRE